MHDKRHFHSITQILVKRLFASHLFRVRPNQRTQRQKNKFIIKFERKAVK